MKRMLAFILTAILVMLASCAGETPEHVCQPEDLWDVPGTHSSKCKVCNTVHLKPEAHTFVSEECDKPKKCSVCSALSDEPPEGHDWEKIWEYGCWYINEISTCKKCGEESILCGDLIYPHHTWSSESAEGKTTYSCHKCSLIFTVRDDIGKFSYAEVLEAYKIGDPGVNHEGFGYSNLDIWETDRPIDIVTKAALVLDYISDIEYDTVSVSFDKDSSTWCVDFNLSDSPDRVCSVYIDSTGNPCLTVIDPDEASETEHICDNEDLQDIPGTHSSICKVCNTVYRKLEAHTFVSVGCGKYKECSVCHEISFVEPPEEHDWKQTSSTSDCWSTTVIYTCTKCGMGQSMYERSTYPHHTWGEESADGKTIYSCRMCSLIFTVRDEIGKFSYAEVLEAYKIGDPGVKHEGFGYSNLGIWKTDRPIDIVTKAALVLDYISDIEYDTVSVSFDAESGTWCVGLYPTYPGGGCDVFVNAEGNICYMVFGE